ncbi:MAG: AzlC family ABC transporter permease [Lachnospiraceae bacterium]|nr:AzlC family ABC transporter permease [Lachnospiraceae bacterium]
MAVYERGRNKREYIHGLRDGFPIGLGYLAVSFSLGITAKYAGFSVTQGFWLSLLNVASAGEYAGIAQVSAGATLLETALVILVTNARYLLMSASLSQHVAADMKAYHRFFISFGVTDELFGIGIAHPGYLCPAYMYGAFTTSIPLWAIGTPLGIIAGNLLPELLVRTLSVAIFGMFLAIIIPPARRDLAIRVCVIVSFFASYFWNMAPFLKDLSAGTKTIILTVVIAAVASVVRPVEDEEAAE